MYFQKIEKKIIYLVHDDNEHCEFDRFYERFKNYFIKNASKRLKKIYRSLFEMFNQSNTTT